MIPIRNALHEDPGEKCGLGYRPWAVRDGVPLAPYWEACIKLIRADYCGDARPTTLDGMLISIYDTIGIQQPDHGPDFTFEAAWDAQGRAALEKRDQGKVHDRRAPRPSMTLALKSLPFLCGLPIRQTGAQAFFDLPDPVSATNCSVDHVFRGARTTSGRAFAGRLQRSIDDTETFHRGLLALHTNYLQRPLTPRISDLKYLFGTTFRFGSLGVHVHDRPRLRIIDCIRNQTHCPSPFG